MKKARLLFYFLLLICFKSISQESIDGIGLITPMTETDFRHKLVIVDFGYTGIKFEDLKSLNIDLHSENEDKPTCFLKAEKSSSNWNIQYNIYDRKGNKELLDLGSSSLFWHGIKSYSLQFYQVKGEWFQVKLNDQYYWVTQENLKKNGYEALTWKEYFANINSGIIARYNMNLRTFASKMAPKVSQIEKNFNEYGTTTPFHIINIKEKFVGNWVEVEVKIWTNNESYCNSEKPIKKLNGWLKYLDDKGYPNIIDNAACLPL